MQLGGFQHNIALVVGVFCNVLENFTTVDYGRALWRANLGQFEKIISQLSCMSASMYTKYFGA